MNLPYEKQEDPPGQRMCGAAALCMVYRSFGAVVTQHDVWPAISRAHARGDQRAHSYLLGADALERGYAAMTLQARAPWRALEELAEAHGIRAIVNHRISLTSGAGHFTVVVAIEGDAITVHDPLLGPDRRIAQTEFLKLWQPGLRGPWASEVTGNILVAFAEAPGKTGPCRLCGASFPHSAPCPACQKTIPLQPARVLGCVANTCGERVWEKIFCPYCDAAPASLGPGDGSTKPTEFVEPGGSTNRR